MRLMTALALGVAALALSGCAYMGAQGTTRADAARALGLSPSDVVIVSLAYNETGPKAADFALANYTVKTKAGVTYSCDMQTAAAGKQGVAPATLVCKPNH